MLEGKPENRPNLRGIIPSLLSLRKMIAMQIKLNSRGENQHTKSVPWIYTHSSLMFYVYDVHSKIGQERQPYSLGITK